jgi:hypothetical protein
LNGKVVGIWWVVCYEFRIAIFGGCWVGICEAVARRIQREVHRHLLVKEWVIENGLKGQRRSRGVENGMSLQAFIMAKAIDL